AEERRRENVDAIAEQCVATSSGRCRVAAANSSYAIHSEIGSLHGPVEQPTRVFSRSDQNQAVALLADYLRG
ncbi:MAG: hypothetical protein ACRDHL_06875, partial [Candidatus Promineifilaceae bacterium]